MINDIKSLRFFCAVAETKQFKSAARMLDTSPSFVLKKIRDLETYFQAELFFRNNNLMELTNFGMSIIKPAKQLVRDIDSLYSCGVNIKKGGFVNIGIDYSIDVGMILSSIKSELTRVSNITFSWSHIYSDSHDSFVNSDIGLIVDNTGQIGSSLRYVGKTKQKIVCSPQMIRNFGYPRDWDHLLNNFPICVLNNACISEHKRFKLYYHDSFCQRNASIHSQTTDSILSIALSGQAVAEIQSITCDRYIKTGQLVEVLSDININQKSIYLYRRSFSNNINHIDVVYRLFRNALLSHF